MQPVVLVGVEQKVREVILRTLSQNGTVAVCEPSLSIAIPDPDPRFLLLITDRAESIAAPTAPLILGKNARKLPKANCGICLLDSSHPHALRAAQQMQLPAVTCGFRASDGLTCSSLTGDRTLLCLQRAFVNGRGERIEPFERPVYSPCGGTDPAALLLAQGVLLWYA